MTKGKMKLSGVQTLIVDSDSYGVALITQMLRGLGVEAPRIVTSGESAKQLLNNHIYDLCICEAELPDMNGADLVRWVRQQKTQLRFMPVIVLTSYSYFSNVTGVRDAGAHLVVKKPVSPQVLYDHIAWAADGTRPFIEAEGYVGPDRRFKYTGPPDGVGRRGTDLSADIGEAVEPNMSQEEIDAMVKPMKVAVS